MRQLWFQTHPHERWRLGDKGSYSDSTVQNLWKVVGDISSDATSWRKYSGEKQSKSEREVNKDEISVDAMLQQPQRTNRYLTDLFIPMSLDGGAVEYTIWSQEDEDKRRASMTRRERWKEDHPHFFRKRFPWTITRWSPPRERDEWDDD